MYKVITEQLQTSTTLDNYSTKVIIILILVATVPKSVQEYSSSSTYSSFYISSAYSSPTTYTTPFILHLHTELNLISQFIQDQEVVLITLILMEIKLI